MLPPLAILASYDVLKTSNMSRFGLDQVQEPTTWETSSNTTQTPQNCSFHLKSALIHSYRNSASLAVSYKLQLEPNGLSSQFGPNACFGDIFALHSTMDHSSEALFHDMPMS